MFDARTTRGPKLVYSHSRQSFPSGPVAGSVDAETVSGRSTPPFPPSHAIPRPSVTVVAQTRKSLKDGNSDGPSRKGEIISSPGVSSIANAINRFSAAGGSIVTERQGKELDDNNMHKMTIRIGGDVPSGVLENEPSKTPTLIHSVDNNNNAHNNQQNKLSSQGSHRLNNYSTSSQPHETSSGNGYTLYKGNLYDTVREIPIILTSEGNDVNGAREIPIILTSESSSGPNVREIPITVVHKHSSENATLPRPSPQQQMSQYSPGTTNSKPVHYSTATASIIKVPSGSEKQQASSVYQTGQHLQPRSLPTPKLNGKVPNGVAWLRVQPGPEMDNEDSDYDHPLPFHQQAGYKPHRRVSQDDPRYSEAAAFISNTDGVKTGGGRRAVTAVPGRRAVRELSPQNKTNRHRAGSSSSPAPAHRRMSPQRSTSQTRTHTLHSGGGPGGLMWTVVTQKGTPRPRSSSVSSQKVTRTAYRLDPKFQNTPPFPSANHQPKSILKSSSNSSTSTAREDDYDKISDFDNFSITSDRSYTLPRPKAALSYRDFDFSGLPQQSAYQQNNNSGKKSLYQTNSLPIQQKGRIPATSTHTPPFPRRPATAGAALHKGISDTASTGQQTPQKKSVTFNSEVRLHVDSNISTIRSLSVDS